MTLRRIINATGVILHTNLGRAPLAGFEPPAGYSNLEYDLRSGKRGKRDAHISPLIESLLGRPAIAVNNNAAAVYLALNEMKKARNPRKAILILSDGGDNSSRYTESEIKNLVREADVQIYAIGIFEPASSRGRTAEELSGPSLLTEVAEQTGGRHFPVENVNELPDVAAKIGIELRNQYMLGYTPANQEKDGKYRRVQVKLVQPRGLPPLRAFSRTGYYAPSK